MFRTRDVVARRRKRQRESYQVLETERFIRRLSRS